MKLSPDDKASLIHAVANQVAVLLEDRDYDPERPYEFTEQVQLDSGHTAHFEVTLVPRAAVVIAPSGTVVHGLPVPQYGGPGPAPDPNDRLVEIRDARGWRSSRPTDVRAGHHIRVSEPDGAFVAEGVATRAAFRNEQGVWTFEVSK